jgi:putative hydrolase of the HAD superfamily
LQQELRRIKWLALDLDNTLHDQVRASRRGMESVYERIGESTGVARDALEAEYAGILAAHTVDAFISGHSAAEYRRRRFSALLDRFGVSVPTADDLVAIYTEALGRTLVPFDDVIPALDLARGAGLRIAIVSEGPHDAQLWTLER